MRIENASKDKSALYFVKIAAEQTVNIDKTIILASKPIFLNRI